MSPHGAARPEAGVRTFTAAISADDGSVARAKSSANDNPTGLMSLFRLSGHPRRWFQLLCLIGPPLRWRAAAVYRTAHRRCDRTNRRVRYLSIKHCVCSHTGVCADLQSASPSEAPGWERGPSHRCYMVSATVHSPVVPCSVVPWLWYRVLCAEWPSCSQFLFLFVAVSWLFLGFKLFNCFQPHFNCFWFVI